MDNRKRLRELDSLKGLIILIIVLYHMPNAFRGYNNAFSVFYKFGGDFGNTVFFIISGFTLCYAYESLTDYSLYKFLLRRIKGIYVLYLLTDLVALYFDILYEGLAVLNVRDFSLNCLLITSGWIEDIYPYNTATWFFSALLLDYIIWFIITKYFNKNRWYYYVLMLFIGLSIQKACLQKPFMYYHTGEAIVPFFEGCLLNKFWKESSQKKKYITIGLLFFLALSNIVFSTLTNFDQATGDWKYGWYVIYGPIILLSALDIKIVQKILSGPIVYSFLGNISKYIFFWHGPLLCVLQETQLPYMNPNRFFLLYFAVLYLFCIAYRTIEKFIIKKCKVSN